MNKTKCTSTKTQPVAHHNSPCSGKYGNVMHVKLVDACNADCAFCIEHDGMTVDNAAPVNELLAKINDSRAQNIVLVGGEPTLYRGLGDLLRGIEGIGVNRNVYMTTNGIKLNPAFVEKHSLHLLTGMNISIHAPTESENGAVLRTRGYPVFETIKAAITKIP